MFVLEYSTKFRRRFKKLPRQVQEKYALKEDKFRLNPFDPSLDTHKLHRKFREQWAFSIDDKYRVLFIFQGNKLIILLAVGGHDMYNQFL